VQCAHLDAPACDCGQEIPDGRGRDRDRFDRADRAAGYHGGVSAGVGVPGGGGFIEGGEAWEGREYLFDSVSLCGAPEEWSEEIGQGIELAGI